MRRPRDVDLYEFVPYRKADSMLGRLLYCQNFLYLRGFITESERDKVSERIRKLNDKAIRKNP